MTSRSPPSASEDAAAAAPAATPPTAAPSTEPRLHDGVRRAAGDIVGDLRARQEAATVGDSAWRARAGREDGPDHYQFGDVTRTVVRGATGAVAGARSRWREAEYGIVEDSASCAPAAPSSPSGAGAAEQIVGDVGRGVGGLWGAGKGLLCGATLGIGKGVVAGVDKAYESAAPVVLSSRQQQKVNRRVESAAQACASEMAPLLGSLAAGFASGALEGCSMAERQLSRAYDVTMPEAAKRDIEQRLEKRFGAVMEHLVEPAVAEAVQSLYIGKIKPALTTDKRMPAWIRRILHDAADELWANVMVEVPHGLNKLVDKGAGGVGADGTEVVGGGPADAAAVAAR